MVHFKLALQGTVYRLKRGQIANKAEQLLLPERSLFQNTTVTTNSDIFLTSQSDGGTPGFVRITAKVASTSFTITSSNASDTSVIAWQIIEEM